MVRTLLLLIRRQLVRRLPPRAALRHRTPSGCSKLRAHRVRTTAAGPAPRAPARVVAGAGAHKHLGAEAEALGDVRKGVGEVLLEPPDDRNIVARRDSVRRRLSRRKETPCERCRGENTTRFETQDVYVSKRRVERGRALRSMSSMKAFTASLRPRATAPSGPSCAPPSSSSPSHGRSATASARSKSARRCARFSVTPNAGAPPPSPAPAPPASCSPPWSCGAAPPAAGELWPSSLQGARAARSAQARARGAQ